MDRLFFKVFRNNFLRLKIFNYIHSENKNLGYFTYSYFNVPIDVMVNIDNKVLLLERLKLHEKYFGNHNGIGNNSNNSYINNGCNDSNSEIYKYYLDYSNKANIINWPSLDLECFELIRKLYPQFSPFDNKSLMECVRNCNIPIFKRIHQDVNFKVSFKLTDLNFKLDKCSTDQVIQTYNYIKSILTSKVSNYYIYQLLLSIINEEKSSELGEFFLNEIDDNITFSNHEISNILGKALSRSDLVILKIILNKISQNEELSVVFEDYIEIYGIKILKKNFTKNYFLVTAYSLFESNLDEFIITVLNYSPRDYFPIKALIKSPKVAQFLIKNENNNKCFRLNRMMFSSTCIEDDLSNKELFLGKSIEWKVVSDISTIQKFKFLRDLGIELSDDYFTKAFNGDIKFLEMFINYSKKHPSKSTLISAAQLGYYDMVQYILLSFPHSYDIQTLVSVLKHCYHCEQIVDIVREISNKTNGSSMLSDLKTQMYSYFVKDYQKRKVLMYALYQIPFLMEDFINYIVTEYHKDTLLTFKNIGFNPHIDGILKVKNSFELNSLFEYGLSNDLLHLLSNLHHSIKLKPIFLKQLLYNSTSSFSLFSTSSQMKNATFYKIFLFLVDIYIINTKLINKLVNLAISLNIPFIIDFLLMIGPFKNYSGDSNITSKDRDSFKSVNGLSEISKSSYFNEIHYLIFLNSYKTLDRYGNRFDNTLIIDYLLSINYQYHSNGFGFIRDTRDELYVKFSELNPKFQQFLKNVGLLNLKSLFFEDDNLRNNDIIQFYNSNSNNKNKFNNNNNNSKDNFYYSNTNNNFLKLNFTF